MEIETYKWDYIYAGDLDKLKELGKQGWEVCGSDVTGAEHMTGGRIHTTFLLKRPCGKVRIVTTESLVVVMLPCLWVFPTNSKILLKLLKRRLFKYENER